MQRLNTRLIDVCAAVAADTPSEQVSAETLSLVPAALRALLLSTHFMVLAAETQTTGAAVQPTEW